jgi:hypothetical protein
MCEICDGRTMDEVRDRRAALMERHGWMIQGVEGFRPWAYTIGLAAHDLPELVWVGAPYRGRRVLNAAARQLLDGPAVEPGDRMRLDSEEFEVAAVHRRHVDRGLMAVWWEHFRSADGGVPELRPLQLVPTEPNATHLITLAGTRNVLRL